MFISLLVIESEAKARMTLQDDTQTLQFTQSPPHTHTHTQRSQPTASSRVLEKLTVQNLVKKYSAFYRTRRFITAFTGSAM